MKVVEITLKMSGRSVTFTVGLLSGETVFGIFSADSAIVFIRFTAAETEQIIKRYASMDPSPDATNGITVKACSLMPEFTGNVFAADIIDLHKDPETKKIHTRNFMKICTMFCRRTPARTKKECIFDMFDVDKQKVLTHDAMFRIYKLFFGYAISDDHILALVFSALRHPRLETDGEVTREEFMDMIPDNEIQERLSIDFAFIEPQE